MDSMICLSSMSVVIFLVFAVVVLGAGLTLWTLSTLRSKDRAIDVPIQPDSGRRPPLS